MRLKALVTVIILGGASLLITPAAAQAGSSLCPSARVCLYDDNNFIGLLGYRSAGQGVQNISAASNDRMESWENKTTTGARWYHAANGGGKCVSMSALTEDNDINFLDANRASSWATNGTC